jgi:hypothetical protein
VSHADIRHVVTVTSGPVAQQSIVSKHARGCNRLPNLTSFQNVLPLKDKNTVVLVASAIALVALVALAGSGLIGRTGRHSVVLNWHSPAPLNGVTVVSYNVYRSVTPGGPYVQIACDVSGLTYRDWIVNNTRAYYYVVTSVDAAGHESTFSTEARANIP